LLYIPLLKDVTELVDLRLSGSEFQAATFLYVRKERHFSDALRGLMRYDDDDREDGGGKYVIKRRSALCGVKPLKIL